MKTVILASASPRRKRLLKLLGLEFRIIPSDIPEKLNPRYKPKRQAEILSLQKARAVAAKQNNALVIGADTLVIIDMEVIGKPKDAKDARRILKKLSGRTHSVITGFTIIDTASKKTVSKSVETKIRFKKLNDREIKNYVEKEKPFDNAGAYMIQERGSVLVEKIEGDYFNVVGLPLHRLSEELKKFGVYVL